MNNYDVNRLALVLSIQAEIEGMKAHNMWCVINNDDLHLYRQQDFDQKAEELRIMASKHDEQL
jgi:hypothetical protein